MTGGAGATADAGTAGATGTAAGAGTGVAARGAEVAEAFSTETVGAGKSSGEVVMVAEAAVSPPAAEPTGFQ